MNAVWGLTIEYSEELVLAMLASFKKGLLWHYSLHCSKHSCWEFLLKINIRVIKAIYNECCW